MGRSKNKIFTDYDDLSYACRGGRKAWQRQRGERATQLPSKLNVDVHGILFAVVAVVFVVYPLIQWALGR